MEIRRYVTLSGKDVFGDWLSRLADTQAKARIVARIDRLAVGNFGDTKRLRGGICELRIDWGRDIAFITHCSGEHACCYSAEATNASSPRTFVGPSNVCATIRKGHNENPTPCEHLARRSADPPTS